MMLTDTTENISLGNADVNHRNSISGACIISMQMSYSIKIFSGRQLRVRRISGQYSSLKSACLVLVLYYVGEFFIGRGPIFSIKTWYICFVVLHYNG